MLINITKINLNPNSGGGKPIELENKEITTYLDDAMMEYSAYVLLHRSFCRWNKP